LGVRMLAKPQPPRILLPKGWQGCVKSAVLYAIALAQGLPRFIGYYSIVYVRAWAADSINARVRLAAENGRLHEECSLLREELHLKDTRMAQMTPQRRPHYSPVERMAILELRAARGWSLKQTADTFLMKATRILFKWLNRRSQRRSFNWDQFTLFIKANPLPSARVCHALY